MANTKTPRNAQGQTYEEWLAQKVKLSRGSKYQIKLDEFIYGMDVAAGIRGVHSSDLGLIVGHVIKPLAPAITDNTQTAVKKYGVISQGLSYGARTINIPVTLKANSNEDYQMRVHQIAAALLSTDTDDDVSITFGDEPDVQYYGRFTSLPDFQFISVGSYDATATFVFTLHDPRGFITVQDSTIKLSNGTTISAAPNELVKVTSNPFVYTTKGTGPADPIFHIIPKKGVNTSRFGMQLSQKEGVWVGEDLSDVKVDTKPLQFDDDTTDMSKWSIVTPLDKGNGRFDGNLTFSLPRSGRVTNGAVGLNNNGQGIKLNGKFADLAMPWGQWYGPVIESQPIGDLTGDVNPKDPDKVGSWEVEVTLTHKRYYDRASQQVEAILLDMNGKRRARVGLGDGGNNGQASGAWIFFGADEKAEATALASGLGSAWVMPPHVTNNRDVTVTVPDHYALTNSFLEYHKITTYTYESWDGTYKTTRTIKVEEWSYHSDTTNKNTYYKKTLSDTTEKHKESGFLVWWWSYHFGNSNSDKNGTQHVGDLHYWEVGNYVRDHDYAHAPADKSRRYTKRTPINIWINNRTFVNQVFESNSANGKKWVQTTDARYYNGTDPIHGKVGVLYQLSQPTKTSTSKGNQKTSTHWIPIDYSFTDKNEHDALDSATVKFVVGYDTVNHDGYYAEMWRMSDETGTAKPLDSKPFWKFEDPKGMKRAGRYKFKPGRVAVWYAKTNIQEDILDPSTNKPVKAYTNDKLDVSRIRAYRVFKKPSQADMITLKAGQKAIIDFTDETLSINGKIENKLIDMYSTFPQLKGGVSQRWTFSATGHSLKDFDVFMEYRPTYK